MHRLITSIIFHHKLDSSPYADFANPTLHSDLRHAFAKEYCACLGLSKHLPLRIVGDIGGGGAISKIEKGRRFMMEKKSEWSQTNELPVSFLFNLGEGIFEHLGRLKSRFRLKIGITRSSHVQSPKNRLLRQIRQ